MANIIDYINWRGDLPVNAAFPWNELDDLVMARASYLPFEQLFGKKPEQEEAAAPLADNMQDSAVNWEDPENRIDSASDRIDQNQVLPLFIAAARMAAMPSEVFHFREDPKLVAALADSRRYQPLTVSDYVEHTQDEKQEQFAAVTIHLPNREMYLSFRGTDASLIGWKEDFNMAFQTHIPAQIEALRYVQLISRKFPHEMMRLGGHSKGGNIAMYAAFYMPERTKTRVLAVLNYDGPGFMSDIMEEKKEDTVIDRFRVYIPQESVVGRLLEMSVVPTVVYSESSNVHQHNIYNWQVMKDRFIRAENLTGGSEILDESLKQWLEETSPEQRQIFVDGLFDVVSTTNAKTVREMGFGILKNFPGLVKQYRSISEEDRKTIMSMLQLFGKSYAGAFMNYRRQQTDTPTQEEAQIQEAATNTEQVPGQASFTPLPDSTGER